MRHNLLARCLAAALAASAPSALFAQTGQPRVTAASAAPVASSAPALEPRTTGTVLLLVNDRVLEGDIVQIGDQYRIRRGTGEVVITAERVRRLCADWPETMAYVRSQANLGDPDERLRLARWCQLHDLREEALAEARVAAEMRPTHRETLQLLQVLERASDADRAATGSGATGSGAAKQAPGQMATAQPQTKPGGNIVPVSANAAAQVDLSADGLALFNTRVQPILMNLCASCHAGNEGGGFKLHRAFENGARAASQRNLAAVMAHLDLDRPFASALLVKAVSVHGPMTQPPIRDRRAVPFLTLQHWVEHVAANNPHLRQQGGAAPLFSGVRSEPATLAVAPAVVPSAVVRSAVPPSGAPAGPNRFPEVISRPLPRAAVPGTSVPGTSVPQSFVPGSFVPASAIPGVIPGAGVRPVADITIPPPNTANVNRILPIAAPASSDPFDPALFNRPR
jgi:hypothetical protein